MRYTSILLTLFLFSFLLSISCSAEPRMQFYKENHDFGDVEQNTKVKHIFTFQNTGSSMLKVKKIKAGWGCTGVLLAKKEIPAGGEGKIEVTLKTGKRKRKLVKYISVYTNDPKNKKIKLKLIANIKTDNKDQKKSSKDSKGSKGRVD